jgi:hypothetical protein
VAAIAPPEKDMVGTIAQPKKAARGGGPALAGAAAALAAVGAGLWVLWGTQAPSIGTLPRPFTQESGSVAVVEPDSSRASPGPAADRGSAAPVRHDSAAARLPADSAVRAPRPRAKADSVPAKADSVPGPRISPFQRSHPWVAVTGERFYYRSSCSIGLDSRDLLYFTSQAEARASGFVPAQVPGCQ